MSQAHRILNSLLRTEKGIAQAPLHKYLFSVSRDANKIQIKQAVEKVYKVKVSNVNTQLMPGKRKRVRAALGWTPYWKKAVVTLVPGQKIELV